MGRKSKIDQSRHGEEIRHLLIDAAWSSKTVSAYLKLKYGEDIAASSLRTWRTRNLNRLKAAGKLPDIWAEPDPTDQSSKAKIARMLFNADEIPDVLSKRVALARLQEARIKTDSENEFNIGKLFGSQTKEIELLNKIYSEIKADLQDLNLFPKAATGPTTEINVAAMAGRPVEPKPMSDALDGVPDHVLAEAGRTLVVLRNDEYNEND